MPLYKAIQCIILSTFCFAIMNGIIKYLDNFGAFQLIFFRSISSFILAISYLLSRKISVRGNNPKLLITRGLVGICGMGFFFLAIKELPLGSAVSLRYISPIFATIFAIFLLREKVKHIQWLFFLIAFSGVLILKGVDMRISLLGLGFALGSAVFSGLVYVVIRKIGNSEHPVVVVGYFMGIATIVGLLLSWKNWTNPIGIEWGILLSLGILGYIAQVFMTKAFQNAPTNKMAPFKYTEVIFSLLIGYFYFQETHTLWSLLGICLIVSGLLLNILYKK